MPRVLRGDHRHAQRHRFEDGQALSFVEGRRDERTPAADERRDVGHGAGQADGVVEPGSADRLAHRVGVGVVGNRADELEGQIGPGAAHPRERLDDGNLVLARLDPPDETDDRPRLGGAAWLGDPLEQIEPPRHVAKPRPSHPELRQPRLIGAGDADHAIEPGQAPCVHRVHPRRAAEAPAVQVRDGGAAPRPAIAADGQRAGRDAGVGMGDVGPLPGPAGGPAPPPMARTRSARGRRNRGARARRRRAAAAAAAPASRCRRASGPW